MIWLWLLPLFLIDYEWWFLYLAAFFIFRSCSIETEEPREEEESETWRAQRDAFIQKREVEREWDRALEDLLICERQSLKSQRLKSIQPPGIRSLVRNNTTTFEYPVADRQSYYFESPIGQQHRRAHNTSNHATNYNAFSTPTYSTSILHQASSSSSSSEYQGNNSHSPHAPPTIYPTRHYSQMVEECRHGSWWDKVDVCGRELCEKCHCARRFILQCPRCGIKACGSCQADLRPEYWKTSVMRPRSPLTYKNIGWGDD